MRSLYIGCSGGTMNRIGRKTTAELILIFLIIVDSLFCFTLVGASEPKTGIYIFAWLEVINFIVEIGVWHNMTGEWLSPYQVFFYVATLFCAGQTFGWAFGLDLDYYDLLTYIPAVDPSNLLEALAYTVLGLAVLQLGAVIGYKRNYKKINLEDERIAEIEKSGLKTIGKILFVISLPSAAYLLVLNARTSLLGGYGQTYILSSGYNQLQRLIIYPSEWFTSSVLMLYIAYYGNKTIRSAMRTLIIIYIALLMITGGRSGAVMLLFAYILARHYLVKPFTRKQIVTSGIVGYFGLVALRTVSATRTIAERTFGSIIEAFFLQIPNALGGILGELGWSLSSTAWTIRLIGNEFRHGLSYLFAFTAIIPNLGFWSVHPATKYSDLSGWMEKMLGRSSGLGYTFIAESYANFWWFGILFLFFLGIIITRILNRINKENAKMNYYNSMFVIMIILNILKSFVRSTFSSIMRDSVFIIGFVMLLLYIYKKRALKRER
jgi:oligosaccharide repeat unit polymerase